MTSTGTTVTTTYEARGDGALTTKNLIDILQDFPIDGELSIATGSNQTDGDWWSIHCVYRAKAAF